MVEASTDAGGKLDVHELCARFRRLYLSGVCDALYHLGLPEQVLPTELRPLFPEERMVGAAYTVQGRSLPSIGWDHGAVAMRPYLEMFERLTPDSLLVSVTSDGSPVGHFGELTANAAKAHGCVGVVLWGNVRDIKGLRDIGFQVFYRDLSPMNGIGRWEMAASEVPVQIAEVTIHPGDIVFCEFDGVLVVPRQHAERVLVQAESIVRAESDVRREVAGGVAPWESFERHGHI
jgi:4-hydroxy-4-methyl-2-oxoglutarate aldolase